MKSVAVLPMLVALLAGCSLPGGSSDSDSDPVGPPPPKVSKLGPFLGECGNVTDDEVSSAMAVPKYPTVFRNSVGCVWESDGSGQTPSASFSWYRGSPMEREAQGSGLIGRPAERFTVGGQPAFKGQENQLGSLCEIGVQYGDDFFHWSITYGGQRATANACDTALKLANLTVARAKS